MRRFAVLAVLVALVVAACGSETLPADADSTTLPPEGSELPTRRGGEEYRYNPTILSGVLTAGECWTLDLGDGPRPVIFPVGFAAAADGVADPASEVLRAGTGVDGMGGIVTLTELPARDDASLDPVIGCVPEAREAIVFENLAPAFDPAVLTTEQWLELLTAAEFTESWGCGIGFAVSTADQHVALVIHANDFDALDATVTLPHEAWTAQVLVGKQLMAQWCDDAVEPWEPSATVSAQWPLTAGVLDFGAVPQAECIGGPEAATLSGIRVETPEGEVELADLDLVNDAFGCFAG